MSSSLRKHFTLYSRDSTHLLLCQFNPSESSQNNSYVLYKGHKFLVCDFSSGCDTFESMSEHRTFLPTFFGFLSVRLGKFHYTTSNQVRTHFFKFIINLSLTFLQPQIIPILARDVSCASQFLVYFNLHFFQVHQNRPRQLSLTL